MDEPAWLIIARELQAIAQTGLEFSRDRFDLQRFERVRELAAQIMAHGSGFEAERILDLFQKDSGYATPKIDVRSAAFRDGRVLMVREISDGKWTLPGGWTDMNQTPAECAVREIFEESGFEARALKVAAIFDYRKSRHPRKDPFSIYKLFFICEITGGAARPSIETSEVGFFALDALPELSENRATAAQIARMFEHGANLSLPTDFD